MTKRATSNELEALSDELRWAGSREGLPDVKRRALRLLMRAKTMSYGGYDGARETAEELAIERLATVARVDARRAWVEVVEAWTNASPAAGQQRWYGLAKLKHDLGASLPKRLRASARRAWAIGRLCNVYTPRTGTSKPTPPKVPDKALDQACVEIGLRQFERARACAANAKRTWPEAELLEFVICLNEGKPREALTSLRQLAAAHAGQSYEHWETICAALVLLDEPDAGLARRCLAAWKRSETNAPTAMFEA